MRIDRVISLIQNRLGLDRYHEEVVKEALARAYNTLMGEVDNLGPFKKTYNNIEVQKDGNQYYSELPVSVMNVEEGVDVNPVNQDDIVFVPVEDNEVAVMNNLDVRLISDTIPFLVQGNKIMFSWMNDDVGKVRVSAIPELSELDMEDDIYVPNNLDEILIETAVSFLTGMPVNTNINDSSELT